MLKNFFDAESMFALFCGKVFEEGLVRRGSEIYVNIVEVGIPAVMHYQVYVFGCWSYQVDYVYALEGVFDVRNFHVEGVIHLSEIT